MVSKDFCDKCGKEIKGRLAYFEIKPPVAPHPQFGAISYYKEYCKKCYEQIKKYL